MRTRMFELNWAGLHRSVRRSCVVSIAVFKPGDVIEKVIDLQKEYGVQSPGLYRLRATY